MDDTYESTSRTVTTPSWRIHVNEAGPSAAPAVIMLHGSGPGATGWSNFNKNIPALAENYHVIAADMPGWGESSPCTWQQRNHTAALVELMDTLGIEKASLIGNSMGGGTSVRFAYEQPDRIEKLITMGSSMGAPTLFGAGGGPTEGLKVLQRGYRNPTVENIRELVEVMTFDSSFVTDELIQARTDMVVSHPEHNRNFIDGIGNRAVVELDHTLVAGIAAPALLFHGRDDRVVHFENSLRLVQLIPNSRLVLINHCGHWLQIEHADEFNRMVLAFLDE